MECPYCAETIKRAAVVCKGCGRDLRLVRAVILEIHTVAGELDRMQRQLDSVNTRLALRDAPVRFIARHAALYVVPAVLLLLVAHYLITIQFNLSLLYLRLASFAIPLPFGMAAYVVSKIGYRSAFGLGALLAFFSVSGMLTVVGIVDNVPIIPQTFLEWRESLEYGLSIALAFLTGNIFGLLVFVLLSNTLASGGKPSKGAFRVARALGYHVGEQTMRSRVRRIQHLMRTVGPLAGVVASAAGSAYAGLKGIIGD